MITIIALVLQVLMALVIPADVTVTVITPTDTATIEAEYRNGCDCHECYWSECYEEAINEFDALFNSYTYKLSRNGRSMVNGKFVAMGAK